MGTCEFSVTCYYQDKAGCASGSIEYVAPGEA